MAVLIGWNIFVFSLQRLNWFERNLISWDIFDFSATTWRNSTKFDWEQDLNVLYVVCVFGRSENQDGCPVLWLAETFSTSPLDPQNGIWWNFTGSKHSMSSNDVVFLSHLSRRLEWAIVIARRPSSVRPASVNFSHFRLLLQNRLMDFDETW